MVNRTNRRPRQRRPAANQPRRLRRAIDRIDYGVKFVPGPDPPEFARAPWWSATLLFTSTVTKDFTYGDLTDGILTLMGGPAFTYKDKDGKVHSITDPFVIRPQTVRVWGLKKQSINLNVYEIVGKEHRVKQMADLGSAINFSRLGWRFGVAANIDVGTNETTRLFGVETSDAVLVYVQVLFSMTTATSIKVSRIPDVHNVSDGFTCMHM